MAFISPILTFFPFPSHYHFPTHLHLIKSYFLPFLALAFQVLAPSILTTEPTTFWLQPSNFDLKWSIEFLLFFSIHLLTIDRKKTSFFRRLFSFGIDDRFFSSKRRSTFFDKMTVDYFCRFLPSMILAK